MNTITTSAALLWHIEHGSRAVRAGSDLLLGKFNALFYIESEFLQDLECLGYIMLAFCNLMCTFAIEFLGDSGLFV
jgi:hypothetical protein